MSKERNNDLPVGKLKLMTKYPDVNLTSKEITLRDFSSKVCVLHLYTG